VCHKPVTSAHLRTAELVMGRTGHATLACLLRRGLERVEQGSSACRSVARVRNGPTRQILEVAVQQSPRVQQGLCADEDVPSVPADDRCALAASGGRR